MKIFITNKPKQTILNILFILGIISFFINILAFFTFILWKYYPNSIITIDKYMPVPYVYKIKGLQLLSNKSPFDTLTYSLKKQLYEELKEISIMHKYYAIRQRTATFLIDYNIKNKNIEQALEIAKDWEKRYPYDFTGKFKYIDVLHLVDENNSSAYYKNFYNKHKDIKEVQDGYKIYLQSIEE